MDPSFSATAYSPDRLIAGSSDVISEDVTLTDISTSGALTRGTVLGHVTANGKFGISLDASADGSQVPAAILAKDADPTGADIVATIYRAGEFNEDSLVWGTGQTLAAHRQDLANAGIIVRDPVSA